MVQLRLGSGPFLGWTLPRLQQFPRREHAVEQSRDLRLALPLRLATFQARCVPQIIKLLALPDQPNGRFGQGVGPEVGQCLNWPQAAPDQGCDPFLASPEAGALIPLHADLKGFCRLNQGLNQSDQ